jgi:hypothetical protein
LDLFVEKILLFAAIGYLALRNLPQGTVPTRRLAWATCSVIAMLIEVGKLFFVGRVPNLDNVVLSSLGALVGVLLIPPLAATPFARQHARRILVILILCILTYEELSPLDWIRSADQIPFRIAAIEWLPFSSPLARIMAPNHKQRFSTWQKNCFCWVPWAFLSPLAPAM